MKMDSVDIIRQETKRFAEPPDQAISKPAAISRRHDLDALRAIAMLLGIALHGALAYMPLPDAAWAVHDRSQSQLFSVFTSIVHGFRMPLFFVISGFFTAMLWRKRGLRSLLNHRLKRIGVPLLLGLFTLVPLVWVVSIAAGIRSSDLAGDSPNRFWTAVRRADIDTIDEQLALGASINGWEHKSGETPLAHAAKIGNNVLITHLLQQDADTNVRNRDGSSPLHLAVLFRHAESVRLLIEHDADTHALNRLGETPADMLSVSPTRLRLIASIGGAEVDPFVDKSEVSMALGIPDTSLDSQSNLVGATSPTDGNTMILLTLFPFFHHLWFLWFLCWFVAAFVVYAILAKAIPFQSVSGLIISPWRYAWLIPLTILPQSMMGVLYPNFGPDTSTGILPMPQVLFYYAIFFFFGALYYDSDDDEGRLGNRWRMTLPFALVIVFPIGYELAVGGFGLTDPELLDAGWVRPAAVVLQVVFVWLMTFGLMGMLRSLYSVESRTMRYVSDSAYWFYLMHLPLIIFFQSLVQNWPIPGVMKFTLACMFTGLLLLVSYQWLVRYTPIGTLLNGPRSRPTSRSTNAAS